MRLSWDEYFFEILYVIRKRATCNRGHNACIIVRDNHILTTGYVGSPSKAPHCVESGHWLINDSCIRTLHAESNAIAQSAKLGISIKNAQLYTFLFPCLSCAKLIIQSGIIEVKAEYDYHKSEHSKIFFDQVNIPWQIRKKIIYNY